MTIRIARLNPEFVELMPKELESGKLYVSMIYATTQHLCACGCGKKVVLPLSPAEWSLHFDGETVSMSPSVGNWEYECRSHYWINRSQIHWAKSWTREQIESGRKRDVAELEEYFEERRSLEDDLAVRSERPPWWRRIVAALRPARGNRGT